jgi:hypothetical protein
MFKVQYKHPNQKRWRTLMDSLPKDRADTLMSALVDLASTMQWASQYRVTK